MTCCRSAADVEAAADADSIGEPPLTQDQADQAAAILAPHRQAAGQAA